MNNFREFRHWNQAEDSYRESKELIYKYGYTLDDEEECQEVLKNCSSSDGIPFSELYRRYLRDKKSIK